MTAIFLARYTDGMQKSKSGFTIIELLVVVSVIAILVGITMLAYSGVQAKSRDSRRKTDIANIIKALEVYYDDNGQYPGASGTNSSINPLWYTSDTTSWTTTFNTVMGSAIDKMPVDPTNSAGAIIAGTAGVYNYGYYANSGTYCGSAVRQMYILVYRLEASPKEKQVVGNCSTNPLGDGYYTVGASYYVVAR